MPEAMAEMENDKKSSAAEDVFVCDPEAIQIVSRDAENAAIVNLVARLHASEGILLRVRLINRLKMATFWEIGSENNLGVAQKIAPPPVNDVSNFHTGSRMIILFDRNLHPRGPVPPLEEVCGVIPFSESNLRLVRSGIQQDAAVHLADNPESELR